MSPNVPPPPPAKKSNVLLWVLAGVGGFFLLLCIVVVLGIAYVARNPVQVMTKMITAANPNVEVLSVNKGSQQITLRDKRTGKTYNISFEDAKNGRFTMRDDTGASVTIGGTAKIPTWVPDYPGSNPTSAFSARGQDGDTGTFSFKTHDPVDKVAKFYTDQFQSSGMKLTSNFSHNEGSSSGTMLTAEDEASKHTIQVIVGVESGNTTVAVTYVTKK